MRIIIFMLLSIIPFVSFSQSWKDSKVSWKDIQKEYRFNFNEMSNFVYFDDSTNISYLKETMEPINGIVVIEYDNGNIACKWNFINGIRPDGVIKAYHINGKLRLKGFIENGKIEGLYKTWHESGKLQSEVNYKAGLEDGIRKAYYENGQLKYEYIMQDGEFTGLCKTWYENGQLKSEGFLEKGLRVGVWSDYDENGNLIIEKKY